ncbi:MAG: glycosyltransferase family 9 protein [Pseudomonadota bacterium]|nr:glycosyltransferase family 9 protein [Pseudomonadota bacterium]
MNILFITSTRVGDAILSSGLLAQLISNYPESKVTIACGPAAEPIFCDVPNLKRIIILDKMLFSLHWLVMWGSVVGTIWDVIVDLRNSPMTYLLLAKRRYRFKRKRNSGHRVEQLASVMGLSEQPPSPKVWIPDRARTAAIKLIPEGSLVLAIGPTANWSAKTWRPDHFIDLLERLTRSDGLFPSARIALFGRDDERPLVIRIIESIPKERCIDLVGKIDLIEVGACIERSDFYIGNDSGLMHLAAAVGIPTLGLFGPSLDELYAPWGHLSASVRSDKTFEEIFPNNFDHRNTGSLMDGLTVDMVEDAARKLWKKTLGEEV